MRKLSKIVLATAFLMLFSVVIANMVAAKNSSASVTGQSTAVTNKPLVAATGQVAASQKLTEAKLKVCQNKTTAIKKRDNQLTKMAENMLTKFDGIATRVKTYYTSKVVPSGKTVSNYDALVAEIATKKSAVQADLAKASTDAAAFNCSSDDPKGQLTLFRTDMQTAKQGLKDYRTSIKNLIVAVRSVTGESDTTSDSTTNND